MTHYKENFYYFFYTHLAQEPTFTKWVDLIQESVTNYPANYGANNLMIRISDSIKGDYTNSSQKNYSRNLQLGNNPSLIAGQGELKVSVDEGETGLDASYRITVDKSLTVDSTLQPIKNFSLLWKTPIYESALIKTADYVWIEPNLSFNYPYAIGAEGAEIRPAWFDTIDNPHYTISDSLQPVWTSITADSSLKVSQTFLIDAYARTVLFTTDTTSYYNLLDIDITEFEPLDSEIPKEVLIIENFPKIVNALFIKYSEENLTKSHTYKLNNRGYIPSSIIGSDMKMSSLTEIAFGILSLISFQEDNLLYLLLSEITYIWANNLKNVDPLTLKLTTDDTVIAGFPTILYKVISNDESACFYEKNRDILENSWLGFALVEATKYFRDRPNHKLIELPPYFGDVLKQLGQLVSISVEESTGLSITNYDDFGYSSQTFSYETSCISSLFLTSLLSIQYDEFVHFKAAKEYLAINDLVDFEFNDSYNLLGNKEKANTYIAYIYWLYHFKKYDTLNQAITTISSFKNLIAFTDRQDSLCSYMFTLLKEKNLTALNISNWLYTSLFNNVAENIYGKIDSENLPSFIISSSCNLTKNNYIFSQNSFYLNADEAEADTTYNKQTAQRLQPNGYHWQSIEALENGELGKLINSYSSLTFSNSLLMHELFNSISILTSQGKILDAWCKSFSVKRHYLQSDFFTKTNLLTRINLNLSAKSGLIDLIENCYKLNRYKIVEPKLINQIFIKDLSTQVFTEYNFNSWSEFINAFKLNPSNFNTLYVFDWQHQLKELPLNLLLGFFIIETPDYIQGLIDDLLLCVAAGINATIHYKMYQQINVKSKTYIKIK